MAEGVNVGTVIAHVKLDTSGLTTGIAQSQSKMSAFAASLNTTTSQIAKNVGRDMMIAGGAIGAALGLAAKQAAGFDQAMRNVNSIAKESEAQFKQTTTAVKALVDDPLIRKGPTDLAKGMYDVVSSGFSGAKALEILRQSAIGAGAGLTDTATSSRALMAVLNSGIKGVDTIRGGMDILFRAVDRGVFTFGELANNIGDVLPTAKIMGVTLQEVTAAMATMTKQGINVSEAQTALNNLLVHVEKPGKEAQKLMDSLGISYGTAAMQAKGLGGWLQDVLEKTHGNTDQIVKLIPELRGMKGELLLLGDGMKSYNSDLAAAKQATEGQGATMFAAKEQAKGAQAQLEKLRAEVERLGIEVGDVLLPYLRDLVSQLRDMTKWFRGQSDGAKEAEIKIAAFGAAALLVGGVVVNLTAKVLELRNALVAAGVAGSASALAKGGGLMALLLGSIGASKTGADVERERALAMGDVGKPLSGKDLNVQMLADQAQMKAMWGIGEVHPPKSGLHPGGSKGAESDDDEQKDLIKERLQEITEQIIKSAQGEAAAKRYAAQIQFKTDIETGVSRKQASLALQNTLKEIAKEEMATEKKLAQERMDFRRELRDKEDQFLKSGKFTAPQSALSLMALGDVVKNAKDAAKLFADSWNSELIEDLQAHGPDMEAGWLNSVNEQILNAGKERANASDDLVKAKTQTFIKAWSDAAEQVGRVLQNAFENLFDRGPKGFFDSLVNGFKKAVTQMLSDSVTHSLMQNLFGNQGSGGGLLGSLFGGLFGGGKKGGGEGSGGTSDLIGTVASILPLMFDNPKNDSRAFRWGKDFGNFFTRGAMDGARHVSAAGAGGGHTYQSFNLNGTFHIREEADINKVADRIAWQMKQRSRVRVGS